MLVVVPTYRRHSNGEAQTFEHVPRDFPLTLAVRWEEAEQYRSMLRRLGRDMDQIWAIPPGDVSGIASTRQWIVQTALALDHDRVVMMDDDLHFIVRGKMGDPSDHVHLRPCDEQDFLDMIAWFDWVLSGGSGRPEHFWRHEHNALAFSRSENYAHAAVSMREGNNREPGLGAQMTSSRGIRVVGYHLEPFARGDVRFRPEVEGREDLDMTLQLLRLGHPNVVTYHWAQGQRSAGAPGGLEGQRTAEQLDRTAELLAELHPGLVRLRTKTNRSGAMAGERTEVTISWKKALQEGRACSASG